MLSAEIKYNNCCKKSFNFRFILFHAKCEDGIKLNLDNAFFFSGPAAVGFTCCRRNWCVQKRLKGVLFYRAYSGGTLKARLFEQRLVSDSGELQRFQFTYVTNGALKIFPYLLIYFLTYLLVTSTALLDATCRTAPNKSHTESIMRRFVHHLWCPRRRFVYWTRKGGGLWCSDRVGLTVEKFNTDRSGEIAEFASRIIGFSVKRKLYCKQHCGCRISKFCIGLLNLIKGIPVVIRVISTRRRAPSAWDIQIVSTQRTTEVCVRNVPVPLHVTA